MTTTVTTRPAVSVAGLRKTFGTKTVLDDIDLTVTEGTVFALLGPNGAGKTTMVRILATLLPADGGSVRVAGHDLARDPDGVRASIGLTGQFAAVDRLLTVQENLRLMASLHRLGKSAGAHRVDELIERFDLAESAKKPVSLLSGGQQRRLDLAMTLVGSPRLIFLDEPTTGLDPRSRHTMWQIVRGLVADGVTVFLTTQYLDEADELADRIAVLDHGRIVVEGTPDELKRRIPGGHLLLRFADPAAHRAAATVLDVTQKDDDALTLQVASDGGVTSLRAALAALERAGIEPADLTIHTPDLDDVFFAFTGAGLEEKR
ncbi:daunorubicin resistance protein DrrA family ABC transporter ATP-binding protein [Actinoplanes cyaneus]|uniref:Daunorubicin resistance protein DrrA family ABC transporter ATP-binding protein n=1 Tax=Actinoplanes cyaneus TaxID=52696 RepID=A0A919M1D8_9ACTN|nr:ATP-binding cassette domain-containing protein [Actinoplanes cyaneus]MCW2142735.1 ABC-2 type transport system ATP-binding protein [Actinoplanes cyaneus]GID62287.1 daunorubicin resistance protein DrrA family ABC transporter ATP-binding protein [Actinoplanes cyaneus]